MNASGIDERANGFAALLGVSTYMIELLSCPPYFVMYDGVIPRCPLKSVRFPRMRFVRLRPKNRVLDVSITRPVPGTMLPSDTIATVSYLLILSNRLGWILSLVLAMYFTSYTN